MSTCAIDFTTFDRSIPATTDLFAHVNGGWAKRTEIPDDKASWGAFHELREASEEAVRQIIADLSCADRSTLNGEQRAIADLYASFMDTETISSRGLNAIQPYVDKVNQISSMDDLARHLGWSARHGLSGLIDIDNDADPADPTRYILFIGQSGISLPDEEYYRLDEHESIRVAYRDHVEAMLSLCAFDHADDLADRIVALETKIAAVHWDKVRTRDMVQMYHPQSWQDLCASTHFNWELFRQAADLPEQVVETIVNAQHTFITDVDSLLSEDSLDDWKAWALWQIVDGFAPYLADQIVEKNFDFYGRTIQGIPQIRQRWKRAVSLVEGILGEAIGKIYVERHFPAEYKQRADELVANLLEAYRRSITSLEWMGEGTRREALDKLDNFYPKIGYPNRWRSYEALTITSDDLIGNIVRANSFEFDRMIEQLSGPINRDEWLMYPQTVNAYYHPLRNEIVFPAAILQPPFFNAEADDAINYGAIGAVIGHEIGHGFDDQGSTCDGQGRLRNWWTDEDRKAFEQRTAALVSQYDELCPAAAPDVHVNGQLTLGENIGDLGGLGIAYQAWIMAGGDPNGEKIDGYSPAQRFFIGWAQTWRTITREKAMKERIATDPHSPDEIRCNQVVRNLDAFHEAFATTPDDPMWLPKDQRVTIW